jgi:hypothetical protein
MVFPLSEILFEAFHEVVFGQDVVREKDPFFFEQAHDTNGVRGLQVKSGNVLFVEELRRSGVVQQFPVRKDEDAERLGSQGLRTVKLDVTDADSIAAARAQIGDGPLTGLVNNAGIAVAGPLEFMPLDQLRWQLEVNLIGQVAVMQQFLPALRAARGITAGTLRSRREAGARRRPCASAACGWRLPIPCGR